MLRAALPRLLTIVTVVVGATAGIGAGLGALTHRSVLHSMAVAYYVVGVVVLIACFVAGSRGPVRRDLGDDDAELPVAAPSLFSSGGMLRRKVRRTTPEERREAKLNSLALFAFAIVLIFLGALLDPSRRAF